MKAELQRFIKLIDNQSLDCFGIKVPFGQMVGDTSRSTDNDGRMISCNAFLFFGNGMPAVAATRFPGSSHAPEYGIYL
jgi:hypothetical protein